MSTYTEILTVLRLKVKGYLFDFLSIINSGFKVRKLNKKIEHINLKFYKN